MSDFDEFMSKPEPEVYSTDERIEAIFQAAFDCVTCGATDDAVRACERKLSDAIDAFGTHAFGEGYDQCLRDMREKELEKACRLMNETGQGEHGVTPPTDAERMEQIWGLAPKGVKRAA
jgi:hypothetical protein